MQKTERFRNAIQLSIETFDRPEPKQAIASIAAKIQEENTESEGRRKTKRAKYDQLIAKADNQFTAKDWVMQKHPTTGRYPCIQKIIQTTAC